ncbi:hypothetical protein QJS10_CPB11g00844 [Acorus calamus]|uniref:SAUR family protein n=1 Tax=Acorus calamus TaxID=4465 RepID=A0AAV9DY04_ACOCL|nr:hypothetical protein QJS10_CPB11g00844 [Acorus calamus]
MSSRPSKCNAIRCVVRLRQMLRRWRTRASSSAYASRRAPPADVPAGHVAVRVGAGSRRFVVRLAHLNHPSFKSLLVRAEEEFGFDHPGPIYIPCVDESAFEDFLRSLDKRRLRVVVKNNNVGFRDESWPLLLAENIVS